MVASPVISVKNLHTKFGKQVIHRDLSLDILDGEVIGIVGGSGTGKSVLLRYMMGLTVPQKGRIEYQTSAENPSSRFGVLFQSGALISSLTVLENITLPMKEVAKIPKNLAEELAMIKLSLSGLPKSAALKYPSQLSGGMVKRAALARALALDPKILFFR